MGHPVHFLYLIFNFQFLLRFRLFMIQMLTAKPAELSNQDFLRVLTLILGRIVIFSLTGCTGKRD